MTAWIKKWWVWLLGGLAAVGGLAVAVLIPGRVKPKLPSRPATPDVELPEPAIVDTKPADDYEAEKVKPNGSGLVDRINRRHG
jgi:hypothetical protein